MSHQNSCLFITIRSLLSRWSTQTFNHMIFNSMLHQNESTGLICWNYESISTSIVTRPTLYLYASLLYDHFKWFKKTRFLNSRLIRSSRGLPLIFSLQDQVICSHNRSGHDSWLDLMSRPLALIINTYLFLDFCVIHFWDLFSCINSQTHIKSTQRYLRTYNNPLF